MLTKSNSVVIKTTSSKKKAGVRLFVGTLGIDCIDYSERCIRSLTSTAEAVKFCYMDNGSTDQCLSVIRKWKDKWWNPIIGEFEVIENGFNLGVGKGWNALIDNALAWGATHIVICNNDIAFGPHTLDGLVEAYERLRKEHPETVMVTAANRTKNAGEIANIQQEWKYHEHPDFSCFMITPETIDRVGKFDERFEPAYFEDNAYHWLILMTGYKAWGCDWAPYSHIASRTRYAHPNLVTHQRFRENKIKFFQMYYTDDVDESEARNRYNFWITENPDKPHPHIDDVMNFCLMNNHITKEMLKQCEALDVQNVPMDNYRRGKIND